MGPEKHVLLKNINLPTLFPHLPKVVAMLIPEFLKKYGNLVQFTQQGMEKLNDQTTINFARSTNHNYRNLDALKQLMDKNRIEHLEDHEFQ